MSIPKNSNFKRIYCGNCGKNGHIYKDCMEPITSLGIIGYKKIDNQLKYLLIQRKHSYGFVDFIRGKYEPDNIEYLNQLFDEMSLIEIKNIFKFDFNYLWNDIWGNIKNKSEEYINSNDKFDEVIKNKNKYNLKSKWNNPEWGFPKGRRNINESNKNCAIREFCEETNLKNNDIIINNNIYPISEIFVGSNNIRYKHIYYVARIIKDNIDFSIKNNYQNNEIGEIGFFSFTESKTMFRNYNFEKVNILKKLEKNI